MAAPAVRLGELWTSVKSVIEASEEKLKTKLETIHNGDEVSNVELLEYQMALAANSLTATICSSVAKERAETLKGVAQKF